MRPSARELAVVLARLEVQRLVRGLALARPVRLEPGAHLLAKGVAGRAQVVFGQRARRLAEEVIGQGLARAASTAVAQHVEMHLLEMARRLVLLAVADRAEGVLRFQRHPAQRRRGQRAGRLGEHAPVVGAEVVLPRGARLREPSAQQRDVAVGELVLDRLEAADGTAELPALARIGHGELEGAFGGAGGARAQREAGRRVQRVELLL